MLLWFKPFLFLFFEERFAHPIAKPPVAMWKLFALLLAFVSVALGAGAFGSLWLVDLRGVMETMWPGYDLFTTEFADYVFNCFAMISSDSSQHWFAVHGLYVDEPDAIADVSDVYGAFVYGYWTLMFIGFFSFLLLMAKLLPMFADRHLPWHEAIIQSNDYPGEIGCSVTVRSYMQPLVWRLRVGAEVDSEVTSESGQLPIDSEESSDEDALSIPSDVDALRDDSDSDYGRGFDWQSAAESDGDADAMAADSDGDGDSMDVDCDSDFDAMAEGLAADVEPMMESSAVRRLFA